MSDSHEAYSNSVSTSAEVARPRRARLRLRAFVFRIYTVGNRLSLTLIKTKGLSLLIKHKASPESKMRAKKAKRALAKCEKIKNVDAKNVHDM